MMSQATRDGFSPHSYCGLVLFSILLLVAGCGKGDTENAPGPDGGANQELVEVIPSWVQREPASDARRDRFVIHSGYWATYEEAHFEHKELLVRRIRAQMDGYLDESAGQTEVRMARNTPEGNRSLRQQELLKKHPLLAHELVLYEQDQFRNLVHISEPYEETKEFSVGLMYQLHSLVEIDTDLKKELGRRWLDYEGRHRVGQLALAWLVILGMTTVLYLHLRTRQSDVARRKRFLLALGLVIFLLALVLLLAQWIQWI